MADGPGVHDGGEDKENEYDSWVLTEQSFQWLIDTNGQRSQMLSRPTSVFSYEFSYGFEHFIVPQYGRRIMDHVRRPRVFCAAS